MKTKTIKKMTGVGTAIILAVTLLTGCGSKGFDSTGEITVISRELGSGTRTAFVELTGVDQKDAAGDKTIDTADITQSTGVMLTSVSQNTQAIGYISMGSLNDTVKAVNIEGIAVTTENVKNGTYKISRPFNIATKGTLSAVAQDFVNYILSADGQKIIENNGYVSVTENPEYSGTKPSGTIKIAGSSSVTPVMEKLKEAYLKINTNATIELNQSDSTTGMNSTIEGVCDIGMASRAIKDSEISKGLTGIVIAMDGIAVIVNKANTTTNLTLEQVKEIYTGTTTVWSDVIE